MTEEGAASLCDEGPRPLRRAGPRPFWLSHQWVHGQSRVLDGHHVLHETLEVGGHRLIGDLVNEVGDLELVSPLLELLPQGILELLGHPGDTRQTALGGDELRAGQVQATDADESGRLMAAADAAGEGRELHAQRRLAGVLTVHDHHALQVREDRDDALEAPA